MAILEAMKSLEEIQAELRAIFASFTDNDAKWKYLLQLARDHQGMDSSLKNSKFLVRGCAAQMYLVPEFKNGILYLHMDTEGGMENPLLSRGLGALAIKLYNQQKPKDILAANPEFFQEIGLTVGLSPTRANGFGSLLKQIYLYAQVYAHRQ